MKLILIRRGVTKSKIFWTHNPRMGLSWAEHLNFPRTQKKRKNPPNNNSQPQRKQASPQTATEVLRQDLYLYYEYTITVPFKAQFWSNKAGNMAEHMAEPNLEEESASLDGYFSDAPLDPQPSYPHLRETFETSVVITNLPKVRWIHSCVLFMVQWKSVDLNSIQILCCFNASNLKLTKCNTQWSLLLQIGTSIKGRKAYKSYWPPRLQNRPTRCNWIIPRPPNTHTPRNWRNPRICIRRICVCRSCNTGCQIAHWLCVR